MQRCERASGCATNLFELVHHFGQLAGVHIFIYMFEHLVHLLHVLDHDVLSVGLLNLQMQRSDECGRRAADARGYFGDDTVDARRHDQELIVRSSILHGRLGVDASGFHIT